MMHGAVVELTTLIAFLTGVLAVAIAVFFQLISRQSYKPTHILAFFVYGAVIISFNVSALKPAHWLTAVFTLLGTLLSLVVEIVGALYAYNTAKERSRESRWPSSPRNHSDSD